MKCNKSDLFFLFFNEYFTVKKTKGPKIRFSGSEKFDSQYILTISPVLFKNSSKITKAKDNISIP